MRKAEDPAGIHDTKILAFRLAATNLGVTAVGVIWRRKEILAHIEFPSSVSEPNSSNGTFHPA